MWDLELRSGEPTVFINESMTMGAIDSLIIILEFQMGIGIPNPVTTFAGSKCVGENPSAKPFARIRWAPELIGPKHSETSLSRGAEADLYLLESAGESVL